VERALLKSLLRAFTLALLLAGAGADANAKVAGKASASELPIVQGGKAVASVFIAEDAGELEKAAAADLLKYIGMMSGASPSLLVVQAGTAMPTGPAILLGKAAVRARPQLTALLAGAAKKKPFTHADAIALVRQGDHVYVAGNNDRAHYFAVSKLLQEWGCRWYMPTDFGEVVPEHQSLSIGELNHVHGSPFEIRSYWLSWLGDTTGQLDFQRRNFAGAASLPVSGHALGAYTKNLIPPGQSAFNVPLSEETTAAEVAARIEQDYAKGVPSISLAIEDGIYTSESQSDANLQAGIYDKYMMAPSNTDAVLTLYNRVAKILREKYPDSPTRLGGLAYSNVTLPPQWVRRTEPSLVMWLAPIDIDPNHGMDDQNSPPRQEYKAMMYRWAEVMEGRLAIYDYDQGQLVWRDLPNPSHHVFAQDVQHYRKAGILGISTESRGATATTFLNLYFRLQLMWNPDLDVKGQLAEFYPAFYGPAAAPMARYWGAIFDAWEKTIATEHEYFVAPVIYTPRLVATLKADLAAAQEAVASLRTRSSLSRNEKLYLERMQFTAGSFEVIENYMGMVRAGASEADFKAAAIAGERALAARETLTEMNPTFTTYKKIGEKGPAWLPGEVQQMRDFAELIDGSKGELITRTPLQWAFRRDPRDTGLARGWAYTTADLSLWQSTVGNLPAEDRKDDPDAWEMLRTDIYAQGQGIRHSDGQSFTGFYWYQTELDLRADQTVGDARFMFPGVFNECWLYINGELVAHRPFPERWWHADYRFQWDVEIKNKLRPGKNLITLRGRNPHHFGGLFRRPFLYRSTGG
jgi:hypothetical protein